MYERRSRLTPRQQGKLIEHFVLGATARAASEVVDVNVKTATAFFMGLRQLIASNLPSYELSGEVEADESYFGGVRKGTRDRGAAGKVAVFGLLKRGGKVYTAIIPNARTETLLPIIAEKVLPDSILSIRIILRAIMRWMFLISTTAESTTQSCLPGAKIISMESRISGTRRSGICANLMASSSRTFTGF